MGHISKLSRRRRSGYNDIASNAIYYKHDDNEKFILTKVLVYLYSIIEKHFIIDEETMEMVSLGLEKDTAVIVDFLLNGIVKCKSKNKINNSKNQKFNPLFQDPYFYFVRFQIYVYLLQHFMS